MKNRRLIYVPKINPRTFLFFYFRGTSGRSYSFRDYSVAGGGRTLYAESYSYTVDDILAMAEHSFDTPTHPTEDLAFWRKQVMALNEQYLSGGTKQAEEPLRSPAKPAPPSIRPSPDAPKPAPAVATPAPVRGAEILHPVFAIERLVGHSVKGAKPQDLDRIFNSKNSEDWVTWNVAQMLQLLGPSAWWQQLVELAARDNPELDRLTFLGELPEAELWRTVATPPDYEGASRTRMSQSSDSNEAARSRDPHAVEGNSEIDLLFEASTFLVVAEAKLGSDVSLRTKHDPGRNQIVRNIDCLLETCGTRTPAFWMMVADFGPGRAYMQLMREYQADPQSLHRSLPHRSEQQVETICRNLALIRWQDLLAVIRPRLDSILTELERRVSGVE